MVTKESVWRIRMGLIEKQRADTEEGGESQTKGMEQMLLYSPKENEELSGWRSNGMRCGGGRQMNPYHQPTMKEGGRSVQQDCVKMVEHISSINPAVSMNSVQCTLPICRMPQRQQGSKKRKAVHGLADWISHVAPAVFWADGRHDDQE